MSRAEGDEDDREFREERFTWSEDTPLAVTQCMLCKHLGMGPSPYCAAFPGGVPQDIISNEHDHREPWIDPETGQPGDMGVPLERSILFEPRDDAPPAWLAALYRHFDSMEDGPSDDFDDDEA